MLGSFSRWIAETKRPQLPVVLDDRATGNSKRLILRQNTRQFDAHDMFGHTGLCSLWRTLSSLRLGLIPILVHRGLQSSLSVLDDRAPGNLGDFCGSQGTRRHLRLRRRGHLACRLSLHLGRHHGTLLPTLGPPAIAASSSCDSTRTGCSAGTAPSFDISGMAETSASGFMFMDLTFKSW